MQNRPMSVLTISMLIVIGTFGFGNVIDNLVEMGLAAIPSWFIVGVLYFLPLALILSEFASDTTQTGGIYSYMVRGLGEKWAFVGTWSYFVSNLFFLQSSFSTLPIRFSLATTGTDVFASNAALIPFLALFICLFLTWLAGRGVRVLSVLARWFGTAVLLLVGTLIIVPFVLVFTGVHQPVAEFSLAAMTPQFDLLYFSTFSWLLFAVSGAEVATPYVKSTRNPAVDFPRAILMATLLIAGIYVLASVAIAIIIPLDVLTKATGLYDIWIYLAKPLNLPAEWIAKFSMGLLSLVLMTSLAIWAESPIRVMFSEVPKGTFPERLTQHDADGTHRKALWVQAMVVCVLILLPLISVLTGSNKSESFIHLINDLASLSLVIPYIFVALAYIQARRKGMDAPFKMARSTPLAIAIGVMVVMVSVAGYFGAGLFALQEESINWIYVITVYAGPLLLIGLGLLLRVLSLRAYASRSAGIV